MKAYEQGSGNGYPTSKNNNSNARKSRAMGTFCRLTMGTPSDSLLITLSSTLLLLVLPVVLLLISIIL